MNFSKSENAKRISINLPLPPINSSINLYSCPSHDNYGKEGKYSKGQNRCLVIRAHLFVSTSCAFGSPCIMDSDRKRIRYFYATMSYTIDKL